MLRTTPCLKPVLRLIACWLLTLLPASPRLHAQWVQQTSGVTVPLSDVTFVDRRSAVAVGARGTILFSSDGGTTWSAQQSGTGTWLSGVAFVSPLVGYVVGWNGVILRTTDGGKTWTSVQRVTAKSLYDVAFCTATTGLAVGYSGVVLRTTDGGTTWTESSSGFNNDLRGVQCLEAMTFLACGSNGIILRTTNAGESWTRVAEGSEGMLYRMRFATNRHGFAVGDKGTILRTENGGVSWTAVRSGTTHDLWDVATSSFHDATVVGSRGTILRSTDGGLTWVNRPSGTEQDLRGVAMADSLVGLIVGTSGTILSTKNAGGCVTFPFPQNATYPFGIMSKYRNHVDAQRSYESWKSAYVTGDSACGLRRVLFDDMSSTTSEGIGYGMLLAVNFNDRPLFDDLWLYYKKFMNERGLMEWHIGSTCEVLEGGAATDADEDAAFALLLADRQWCSDGAINYKHEAVLLINRIWEHEVEKSTFVLKPGDSDWGGSHMLNPSYFAPAYYRAFEAATGNAGWRKVIARCYEILKKCAHPETGLVPDWCRADGSPAPERAQSYYYYWDAARTPWRIALDYLWYGNEDARQFCEKIVRFASSIGAANIANGYYLDGKPVRSEPTSIFIGPFGAAAMAAGPAYQAFADAAYRINVATTLPPENNYYNWSIRTLTLFLQTGNFFGPLEGGRKAVEPSR